MIKINFSNKFKNIKKSMNISKNENEILLEHPNVFDYFKKYKSIENGKIIFNGNLSNILSAIDISNNDTIIDKETHQNLVIYIKDQFINNESEIYNKDSNYKFHISFCKTLEEHTINGGRSRYVAIKHKNNNFEVNNILLGSGKKINAITTKKMNVCKNCLSKINYKNFNSISSEEQEKIVKNFSLEEFYNEYESKILYIPISLMNDYNKFKTDLSLTYVENWSEISRKFREYKNWTCEKCGKNMKNNKFNLHVHHIDHNKRNNNYSNLLCVCRECHSKMPGHGYMK